MPNLDELLSWINDNRPTLFLDRDGVINKRIPGAYVEKVEQFNFFPNLAEHFKILNKFFSRVIVVTNQQGIGKELMTHEDLAVVHDYMLFEIEMNDGVVDAVYYCPELADFDPPCRKPNPGMALEAKTNFPDIDFKNSLMVGDSESDIQFGNRLGMKTLLVKTKKGEAQKMEDNGTHADFELGTLMDFIRHLNV